MQLDNQKHRKKARAKGWDYGSPAEYFVTICSRKKVQWFGEIKNGKMELSDIGEIAEVCWKKIPEHFPHVKLGAHVIMPDHIHGIIEIRRKVLPSVVVGTMPSVVVGRKILRPYNERPYNYNETAMYSGHSQKI